MTGVMKTPPSVALRASILLSLAAPTASFQLWHAFPSSDRGTRVGVDRVVASDPGPGPAGDNAGQEAVPKFYFEKAAPTVASHSDPFGSGTTIREAQSAEQAAAFAVATAAKAMQVANEKAQEARAAQKAYLEAEAKAKEEMRAVAETNAAAQAQEMELVHATQAAEEAQQRIAAAEQTIADKAQAAEAARAVVAERAAEEARKAKEAQRAAEIYTAAEEHA